MHKFKTTKSKYISHLDDVGGSVEVLPAAATRQWRCRRWHRECAAQTLLGPAHRDGITTAATVSVHTAREARLAVVLLVDVARERVGGLLLLLRAVVVATAEEGAGPPAADERNSGVEPNLLGA